MYHLMTFQVVYTFKRFLASVTRICFLCIVNNMFFQRISDTKGVATTCTNIWTMFTVYSLVSKQICTLSKYFLTSVTFKMSGSCMCFVMLSQVYFAFKSFITAVTVIGSLCHVHYFMTFQLGRPKKRFVTNCTNTWTLTLSTVSPLMCT